MRARVKIPKHIQEEATFKAMQGIVSVIYEAYDKRKDKNMDFDTFCSILRFCTKEEFKEMLEDAK